MPGKQVSTKVSTKGAVEPDGRRRRSHDSRARIVAAILVLIREGEVAPGAEQVADRAQVGLRTVFRHFNDMESLYREIAHATETELRKAVARPFKGETWSARVLELIERRTPVFDKIAPFRRSSDAHRHTSPFLSEHYGRLSALGREIVRRELPPEIADDPVRFETLDFLLSYEAWSRLRREQNLSPKRAREVLEAAVRRVIED